MNKVMEITQANPESVQAVPPALLYEMVRSFATLARTLNLSHAVQELKSTRQTVRRHITLLEDAAGGKLFNVEDRNYQLTALGAERLPGAEELLVRGEAWFTGKTRHVNNLMGFSFEAENGWGFHQQQQPLTHIWEGDSALLGSAVTAWSNAAGHLEDPAFAAIRPYALVYRDTEMGWLCCEVGEESFYSRWWGWAHARSSIGRGLGNFAGGPQFNAVLNKSFDDVKANRGLQLDEIATRMPRTPGGPLVPLAYRRLILGGRFPDDSFALIVIVEQSERIRIKGLDQSLAEQMPEDAKVKILV